VPKRSEPSDPGAPGTSAAHELEGDERMYTGEPVETESGLRRPQQMNVGEENMEGGGEWPDPHAPAAPGAPGWDRQHGAARVPGVRQHDSDARITADHGDIRAWVEAHGGRPVRARPPGTGAAGVPQIDFLEGRGDRSLELIGWDEWFRVFDDNDLALLFRDGDAQADSPSVEFVRR